MSENSFFTVCLAKQNTQHSRILRSIIQNKTKPTFVPSLQSRLLPSIKPGSLGRWPGTAKYSSAPRQIMSVILAVSVSPAVSV